MELRNHLAPHDAELRAVSPRASSLCHSTPVRMWGERSRRDNNSSKQQQSRPNQHVRRDLRRLAARCTFSLFASRFLTCLRSLLFYQVHLPASSPGSGGLSESLPPSSILPPSHLNLRRSRVSKKRNTASGAIRI